MKKNSETDQELIDAFIHNNLNSQQLATFNAKMDSDPVFKAEVELQLELEKWLSPSSKQEQEFVSSLEDMRELVVEKKATSDSRLKKRTNKWLWLLPLVLAIPLLVYFLPLQQATTETAEPPLPKTQVVPTHEEDHKVTTTSSPPSTTKTKAAEKPPQKLKETQPTKELPKATQKNPLVAMVDYKPNPSLESLIPDGTRTRGSGSDFKISQKQADRSYVKDSPIKFSINGKLNSHRSLRSQDLVVYLFSNKLDDYKNFNFLIKTTPILTQSAKGYELEVDKSIQLEQGLYYYLIEVEETEELLFVEKFAIR